MRRAILLSVPAVSAMVNWSPANLHLPSSLSSLLHPTSTTNEHGVLLPPAEALKETVGHDEDSVIVVVNPALDAVLASASKTQPDTETNTDTDIKTVIDDGQIEDADVNFVSPFLPPPPTFAKGDTGAPISSHTTIPEVAAAASATLSVVVTVVDDTGYLADEYLPVTDPPSDLFASLLAIADDEDITEEGIVMVTTLPAHADDNDNDYNDHDENDENDYGKSIHAGATDWETELHAKLDCLKEKMRAMHRQSTRYLIPTSSFQWLVFAFSFSFTLLVIGTRVLVAHRLRRRRGGNVAKELAWEKMRVAGVEVGMVKRRVLRRGECVWIVVPAGTDEEGGERLERVWLEDAVGVRGTEVWDQSLV